MLDLPIVENIIGGAAIILTSELPEVHGIGGAIIICFVSLLILIVCYGVFNKK